MSEPIAIVGMACRFPGATNLGEFWRVIERGEVHAGAIPGERWEHQRFFDDDRRAVDKSYTDRLATVPGDVLAFPARHFGLAPRRVEVMDPQHRLLLHVARDALQDADLERRPFDRTRTGVFVGTSVSEYKDLLLTRLRAAQMVDGRYGAAADERLAAALNDLVDGVAPARAYSHAGTLLNMTAAAVSQAFDLQGPAVALDTACSSALMAVHEAVLHLRTGQCTTALAGGVYLALSPDNLVGFSRIGAVSPSGVCRPFDSRADGFVLGEGAGIVVLRRLADARRDGDRVYGLLRGSGASNDGHADGPMTPRPAGQRVALKRAYADADVRPSTIGLVEAHGTATPVGDAVELAVLSEVMSDRETPCPVTSVKANIGHAMSAAGIAGLIKAVLCLTHTRIPHHPNHSSDPDLPAGLRVPATSEEWISRGEVPRRAAVSSFGFGGTNVHVILEEAPAAPDSDPDRPELVLSSADTPALLAVHLRDLADVVSLDPTADLASVARTLAGRDLLEARAALVVLDRGDLVRSLRGLADAIEHDAPVPARSWWNRVAADRPPPRIAFVFPGQGTRPLRNPAAFGERFPIFRERMTAAGSATSAARQLMTDESLPDEVLLRRTDLSQPAVAAVGIAVSELLRESGVAPTCVVGHSIGEFAAACAAGAVDEDEILRFVAARGVVMHRLSPAEKTEMLALSADHDTVLDLLNGIDGAWISAINSARQVVVGGTAEDVGLVESLALRRSIRATRLPVEFSFHTPLVGPAEAEIQPLVESLRVNRPTTRLISTVNGVAIDSPDELRTAWRTHATQPVAFAEALAACRSEEADVALQVCGGTSLLGAARGAGFPTVIPATDSAATDSSTSDMAGDAVAFLSCLGRLSVLGVPVDGRAVCSPTASRVWLPPTPLSQEVYTAVQPSHRVVGIATPTPAPAPPPSPSPRPTPAPAPPAELVALVREQTRLLEEQAELLRRQTQVLEGTSTGRQEVDARDVEEPMTGVAHPASAPRPRDASARTSPGRSALDTELRSLVAEVSAFPSGALQMDASLIEDLGFDSLMLAELDDRISDRWPSVGSLPTDLLTRTTTLAQLATHLRSTLGEPPAPTANRTEVDFPAPVQPPDVPQEHARVEAFPEVVELDQRLAAADRLGIRNPYSATPPDGPEVVSFSSYDYLGLSRHPDVVRAAQDAVAHFGTSVSASRIASGERTVHRELERALADFLGTEDALAFVSGHATNVTTVGHLLGPDDLFVHDALAHDSLLQGAKLSGARRMPFPHNDLTALDRLLTSARGGYRRVLIAAEGVYSMDGDVCDLAGLVELKQRHDALLLVDEAHSLGVLGRTGRGIGEVADVPRAAVDMWMGTLSKSLASCGGYIAGSGALTRYLRYTAPGFVYSVGMPPASAAAATAALDVLVESPQLSAAARTAGERFLTLARAAGLDTSAAGGSAIVPVVVGDSALTLRLADALLDAGISVAPILHPAVAERSARLRFFLTATHTERQIERAVRLVVDNLRSLRASATVLGSDVRSPGPAPSPTRGAFAL